MSYKPFDESTWAHKAWVPEGTGPLPLAPPNDPPENLVWIWTEHKKWALANVSQSGYPTTFHSWPEEVNPHIVAQPVKRKPVLNQRFVLASIFVIICLILVAFVSQQPAGTKATLTEQPTQFYLMATPTGTMDPSVMCGVSAQRFPTYLRDGLFGMDKDFVPVPGKTYFLERPDLFYGLWTQDGSVAELEAFDPFKAKYDEYGSFKHLWDAILNWSNLTRNAAKRDTAKSELYFQNFGASWYLEVVRWLKAYDADHSTPPCLRFAETAPEISAEERASLAKTNGPDLPGNPSPNPEIPGSGPNTVPTPFQPPSTPTMVVEEANSPFALEQQKINSACETTTNPGVCVDEAMKMRVAGNGLADSLQKGIDVSNAGCGLNIDTIAFSDLYSRDDIRNASLVLHVTRKNNSDPSTLTGVGINGNDGRPSVCITTITGAPNSVGGGTWQNANNFYLGPSSDRSPWFQASYQTAQGPTASMLGGIISFTPLYGRDTATYGTYGVSQEYTVDGQSWAVYEVCQNGLCLSPVTNLVNGNPTPTPNPSVTPIPHNIERIMVVTSTPGLPPTPASVGISGLKSYAAGYGYTQFFLFYNCNGAATPPSNLTMSDGRFSVTMDLSGVSMGCSYQGKYAAVTTDNMSSSGWIQVGDVWVSP